MNVDQLCHTAALFCDTALHHDAAAATVDEGDNDCEASAEEDQDNVSQTPGLSELDTRLVGQSANRESLLLKMRR